VAPEDPPPDGPKDIPRPRPDVADGEFQRAALCESHINREHRKSPRILDVIKGQVWVEWLAVAPDLPFISRRLDLSGILRESVSELREVAQHAAVVAVQLEPREDNFLVQLGRVLDARLIKNPRVKGATARFALAGADATTQFAGGHRQTP